MNYSETVIFLNLYRESTKLNFNLNGFGANVPLSDIDNYNWFFKDKN